MITQLGARLSDITQDALNQEVRDHWAGQIRDD